jgi:hypothetical protein
VPGCGPRLGAAKNPYRDQRDKTHKSNFPAQSRSQSVGNPSVYKSAARNYKRIRQCLAVWHCPDETHVHLNRASVAPASNSSARRRVAGGMRLRFGLGVDIGLDALRALLKSVHISVEEPNNEIKALPFGHLRSFQWPSRDTVNSFVTAMPRVLGVGLEAGQFGLCGVSVLNERIITFANERVDLLECDPLPLPGTFVGEHFQNFGKLGVRHNALPPTIIGGIN